MELIVGLVLLAVAGYIIYRIVNRKKAVKPPATGGGYNGGVGEYPRNDGNTNPRQDEII